MTFKKPKARCKVHNLDMIFDLETYTLFCPKEGCASKCCYAKYNYGTCEHDFNDYNRCQVPIKCELDDEIKRRAGLEEE